MKRKALFIFGILIFVCGISFLFRYHFVVGAAKIFLGKSFPKNLVLQDVNAAQQKIWIRGLHFFDESMEMSLENVELEFDFKKICLHPFHLIGLYQNNFSEVTDFLTPIQKYGFALNIDSGNLILEGKSYFFQFKRGEQKHEVGTLLIAHDRELDQPFLMMKFHLRGQQMISQVSLHEESVEKIYPIAAFFFPQYLSELSQAKGNVQLQANLVVEEDGCLEEFSTRFRLGQFGIAHHQSDLQVECDALVGEVHYPENIREKNIPLWQRLQCGIFLENGSVSSGKQFFLSGLKGNVSLDSNEDPKLMLTGELANPVKPLLLELRGKAPAHEDNIYRLEFGLELDDFAGTKCSAFLSASKPEKETVIVQIEANNLLSQQAAMLKGYFSKSMPRLKDWEILGGSFGGKLVTLFEKGALSHFEIQDFSGKNVLVSSGGEPLYFASISGEGKLFSDLNFTVQLPLAHFFRCISPELKNAYAEAYPEELANVNASIQFSEQSVKTSACVDFIGFQESLQLGFTSKKIFPNSLQEVTEAWARSEKLTSQFYAPLVQFASEDLQIYGEVDLLATYDGKIVECSLQMDHFLAKHPLLDLKAASIGEKEKTVGRVKLRYNPFDQHFEGTFPIRNGEAYDRQYGFFFTDVEGDFQISASKLSGHLAHANVFCDSSPLIQGLGLHFSLDKEFEFQEIRGELVLPTNHKYSIRAPRFDKGACEISLYEDKKELAHFKGEKQDSWRGVLALPLMGRKLPLTFAWDFLQNQTSLKIADENFLLKVKKEKEKYLLETLQIGRYSVDGEFCFLNGGLEATCLKIATPEYTLMGSGLFRGKLPQIEENYALLGEFSCHLDTLFPIPMKLHGCQPLKWAFSPEMGLVMSGLNFAGEDCELKIEHLENLPSGKQSIRKIDFALSEALMEKIFDADGFPSFLRDFRICKGLIGKANVEIDQGETKVRGALASKRGDLDVEVDWKEGKGTFSFGQEEKIIFHAHKGEKGLQFDEIQGSLGRLSANLKSNRKGELKGSVQIDFSLFDELFDLPLNRFVHLWKAGSGYQFEGTFFPNHRLVDWGFKGKIKGHSFECGGYQLRSLDAKIEVQPGHIAIENVDLTDDAGKLWIEEGNLMKTGPAGQWVFSFPLVEIRGFQPSFLRKISGSSEESSALILKTATLREVRGRLDDANTISCQGNLRFTNYLKKEERKQIAHLDAQALKQQGLEMEMLIPTSGEMEYAIQNGKIYVRDLRNMACEKNRLEFTPPKNGMMGYLDFEGNLFIDLILRQKAVNSLSAPISLKVRGTWDQPQIQLK